MYVRVHATGATGATLVGCQFGGATLGWDATWVGRHLGGAPLGREHHLDKGSTCMLVYLCVYLGKGATCMENTTRVDGSTYIGATCVAMPCVRRPLTEGATCLRAPLVGASLR